MRAAARGQPGADQRARRRRRARSPDRRVGRARGGDAALGAATARLAAWPRHLVHRWRRGAGADRGARVNTLAHRAGGPAGASPSPGARSPAGDRSRPAFWEGALAVPQGVRFIAERPACWPAASVPCLILLLMAVPLAWWAIGVFGPWL